MDEQNISTSNLPPHAPSPRAQSWGALLSIIVIVLMIIIGAFYAWGERISETNALTDTSATDQ